MANDREPISLGFGIEQTVDSASASLLDMLTTEETATASPEDVTKIAPKNRPKSTPKKLPATPVEDDEEEDEEEITQLDLSAELLKTLEREEEEETEEEEDAAGTTDDIKEEVPVWTSLSNDLHKLGLFTADEDEEGNETFEPASTPEEFKDRFVTEMKKSVQSTLTNFIGKFGEDYQNAFQAIYVDGVDPKEYFSAQMQIENLKELDLTQENNQKLVIKKALADQGFEKDDIDEEIARLENYGDLEKMAQRYHKVIAKKEETKLADMAASKQAEIQKQKQIDEQYENNVFSIIKEKYNTKSFDGIPVNKAFAEKTMDYMTTKKYRLPSGELLTEFEKEIVESKSPANHATRVKYAMLLQLLKTDPSLSSLQKKTVSAKTNQVFDEVARHTKKSLSQSNSVPQKKKSFLD
jgi:hypothetical protein